jgi:antitoxin StbD
MLTRNNPTRLLISSMVSITRFNRGEAGKIFEEVAAQGTKIVVKNNTPTCVLVEPEKYIEMMDALENFALMCEADDRLKNTDLNKVITQDQIMTKYNISQDDLDDIEVEIE